MRTGLAAAVVCWLAAAGSPGTASAGLTDSRHDFTKSDNLNTAITVNGKCSACHVPHNAQTATRLWGRSLTAENAYYIPATNPNYRTGATLFCYDCHDEAASGRADAEPAPGDWYLGVGGGHQPQDIALGTGYPDPVGYYELIDGTYPPNGTPPQSGSPTVITGGHYWKTEPTGTPDYVRADKIACELCHDPHNETTGTNDVFFRTEAFDGGTQNLPLGDGLGASPNVRNHKVNGTGREMCAACHGYSNTPSTKVFWGVNLGNASHIPPSTISQHNSANATPCTNCHKHNKITISCQDCHGFPPLRTISEAGGLNFDRVLRADVENYDGGAGAHRRHKDALGAAIFQCDICHGPNPGAAPWHNAGNGSIPNGAQVNLMGKDSYWAPAGYPGGLSPMYTGGPNGPASGDAGWSRFSKMGGAPRRCSGLACHGNPLISESAELNWTDDMVDGDTPNNPNPEEIQICKWCHDATPAIIAGMSGTTYAPNVMGNGLATAAGFGAEVSGHGVGLPGALRAVYDKEAVGDGLAAYAGAAKDCIVCHDATYVSPTPRRTHFGVGTDPRDEKRLRDTINSAVPNISNSTVFPTGPDEACSACHQNGVAGDGADWSHHGIPPQPPPAGGYVPSEGAVADPPFTRACRQCHDVHGANWNGTGRNLHMVGKWIDANDDGSGGATEGAYVDSNATTSLANITAGGGPANDNAVVFTSTTGANSFDENDGVYDPADDTDDVCATCHSSNTRGGNHSGTPNFGADMRGQNCLQCHDHDYDNAYATADAFMPSGCEGCHGNPPSRGCDNTQGTADDAPNVMGNGVSASGTAAPPNNKPFDDGTFGFNVNGHGANGTRIPSLTPNLACIACHDISSPAGAHFNCTIANVNLRLNTKFYFGKPADTRNANTSHLVSGFLAGANNPQAKQIGFDDYCYNTCHVSDGQADMRHGTKVGGVPDEIMQFSNANDTTDDPKQDRGVDNVWTPWTIDDLTNVVDANPPAVRHHGVCVSCHDPHGTSATQKTRLTNKMVIRNWKGTSMQPFCSSNCHIIP